MNTTLAGHGRHLEDTAALLARFDRKAAERCKARACRWQALVREIDAAVVGTVLVNGQRYAAITPDVQPGMSRYSCFDERGPFSHGVYRTPEAALIACFDMGYDRIAAPQALDDLARQWA